jgi:protein involved in polysaccharide export with SLBB domain
MAEVSKRFAKGHIVGSGTISDNVVAYTVPENKNSFVKAITLCNPRSALNVRVTVKFAGISLISYYEIKPSDTITIPFIDQILEAGETIEILIQGTTQFELNYYISGREVDA